MELNVKLDQLAYLSVAYPDVVQAEEITGGPRREPRPVRQGQPPDGDHHFPCRKRPDEHFGRHV